VPVVLPEHKPLIFAIFGAGFVGVMLVFTLMYRHAYRKREELELNDFELFETQHSIRRMILAMAIGATYFVIAFIDGLPHRTAAEKRVVLYGSIAVLVVLAALMAQMLRMVRHRKRVKRDWLQRPPDGDGQ
jgi:uncharacterized integral membrane protein